jgi:hypothetical protein
LKAFIVEAIDEMIHPNPCAIPDRYKGGKIVIVPGNDSQEKEIPLDVFFKKLVTARDSLRVLEQKINTQKDISAEERASWHGYITKAYGTLTTFNILFKNEKDKFVGAGKKGGSETNAMSMKEAAKKLGLNEY